MRLAAPKLPTLACVAQALSRPLPRRWIWQRALPCPSLFKFEFVTMDEREAPRAFAWTGQGRWMAHLATSPTSLFTASRSFTGRYVSVVPFHRRTGHHGIETADWTRRPTFIFGPWEGAPCSREDPRAHQNAYLLSAVGGVNGHGRERRCERALLAEASLAPDERLSTHPALRAAEWRVVNPAPLGWWLASLPGAALHFEATPDCVRQLLATRNPIRVPAGR